MQIEKKYWTDMLDADSAAFRLMQNAYVNNQNFRFGPTTDKNGALQLEAIGGNLEIVNNFESPTGQNICIGYAYDYPNRRVVYFCWNSTGDYRIFCYDYTHQRIDPVLLQQDIIDSLNFDKYHLIHSARVENGCVYWTDNFNEPRRININAGIEMYLAANNMPARYKLNTAFLTQDSSDPANLLPAGWSVFTFYIPPNPVPSYMTAALNNIGLTLNLYATGSDTSRIGPLSVPTDWPNIAIQSPEQCIVDGLVTFLITRAVSTGHWQVITGDGYVTLYINNTWDFGTGDPTWGQTLEVNIRMDNFIYADGTVPNPYVSKLDESVISWIRRQPGIPLNYLKQVQTVPALSSNLIANEAMQFAYRYIYHDGELSTLSPYTTLSNFNADQDTFNRIDIVFSPFEKIDQDVIQIDVVVRYLISGIYFVVHSWRKSVPADTLAINSHNSGVQFLSFAFYNDVAGIALDAAYSVKPYDSVPLLSQTIEMAKQRAFMGNYKIGYNTPTLTSLAFTTTSIVLTTSGATTIVGEWNLLGWQIGIAPGNNGSAYVVVTTQRVHPLDPAGAQFIYTFSGIVPPFLTIINASQLTYRGGDAVSAANNIQGGGTLHQHLTDQGVAVVVNTGVVPGTGQVLATVFKSYASYQIGIHFRDRAGRACGELTAPFYTFNTPDVFNGGTTNYNYINAVIWTLSNVNAVQEIPLEAYYYSVDITLCLRTRFFVQGDGLIIYAARDSANNYTFTTTAYASNLAGVAIDISGLQSYAQGYLFSQGDQVRLFVNNAYYSMSIIGQSAQYIICQLFNVGGLSAVAGHYEIFTPYQRQQNEPFFQQAQVNLITTPGTAGRAYGVTTGNITGDVFVFTRGGYLTEGMSPTDKHYSLWFTNAGRPNFINAFGQVTHLSTIAFSNTFIAGAQNNGLSTFDALDTQDISPDFGAIQKLQLASKVSKVGTVMLAICSGPTTASIYLAENTLISQTGDSIIAQANTVIGSIHELKGDFGTLNPESVVEFRGNIYWFDVQNGMIIQYADNGLFPISNYRMSKFWRLFANAYKLYTPQQIEGFGSRPYVFGGVDPFHGELLFSVPRVLNNPANGYLPDYPSIIWPFDIWDGFSKTLVYKLYTDPNHWQGSYGFSSEYTFNLENNLFTFKAGKLYHHNETDYCVFYGELFRPAIMGVSNQQMSKPKLFNNISIEANQAPTFSYFFTTYPYNQSSDLADFDFENKEGIWYAPILRNKLDPAFGGQYAQALVAGEKMRSATMFFMLQWPTQQPVQVKFVNIGYTATLGQKV